MAAFLTLVLAAFVAEYIDVALGMGFGTVMTPTLIALGYDPLVVLPLMLFLQAVAGLVAGIFHHYHENVDYFEDSTIHVSALFISTGIFGAAFGPFIAMRLPTDYLQIIIAMMVILSGAVMFLDRFIRDDIHRGGLLFTGLIAAISKTMTGVYGPIVTTGQILSGTRGRKAVAVTIFSEGVISVVGFMTYVYLQHGLDWTLFKPLVVGVLAAIPLATYTVSRVERRFLRRNISLLTVILGLALIAKTVI